MLKSYQLNILSSQICILSNLSVILLITVSLIFCNVMLYKHQTEQTVQSYENVASNPKAGEYEMAKPGKVQSPAEYTDLKV